MPLADDTLPFLDCSMFLDTGVWLGAWRTEVQRRRGQQPLSFTRRACQLSFCDEIFMRGWP
jgi:hypothetical protein